jgi:hypothetical protein
MKFKFAIMMALFGVISLEAGQRGGPPALPPVPRAASPIDLTGYWVGIVSEDWRWRMGVGLKGDYGYLTLNPEGRKAGDSWDPAKDEAAGQQCKTYGAVGVMRLPTRLHITWENDDTMKVETDAGTQTRVFHFAGAVPPGQEPSWQGYSAARWEFEGPAPPRGQVQTAKRPGQLRVITTNMLPGYIYRHGVPYSGNARLTEYFEINPGLQGEQYLSLTATVDDPQYWAQPFVRTVHFRREPDGSKWSPTACSSK